MQQLLGFAQNNRKEFTRFIKFSVVGTLGFIIDFGLLSLLHLGFGVSEIPANVVSVSAAIVSNFLWNRYWVYPDSRARSFRRQFAIFTGINLVGLIINNVVFAIGLLYSHSMLIFIAGLFDQTARDSLDYIPPKLIATVVVLFWNFFVNRYWTFNDVD